MVSIRPALRLIGFLSVFGALIASGVLLGLFAFDDAQAHVVAPTPTATLAPTRTPVPTSTPTRTPPPSPTPRPAAVSIGQGLAYVWKPRQTGAFENVFSCKICGDGKPDNREHFVCATGYEATLNNLTSVALRLAPGWDGPGVCIVGVWGATYNRTAIAISSDVAQALGVTPGKAPEIEIYDNDIPEGYLLTRPATHDGDDRK